VNRFSLNDVEVAPGQRKTIDLNVTRLYTHSEVTIPVHVINGKRPGPRLFVSAAMHGDELNGVEIIRRLLKLPMLKRLRGVLIAVPIVNIPGLLYLSRYLPDRRDLNRSFPGSAKGSLAARLAHLFMEQIVHNSTHGIDLHTGSFHRENLPQIRAQLDDPDTMQLAKAFRVPVLLNSQFRDGSMRQVAAELGIPVLLYEAGEALRFDELSIRAGLRGIVEVMHALDMLPARKYKRRKVFEPVIAYSSSWIRAPMSGILRVTRPLGAQLKKGDVIGMVSDPYGEQEIAIVAPAAGIVIGRVNLPLVHEGDALFHLAKVGKPGEAAARVEQFQMEHEDLEDEVNFDPPIV